MSNVRYTPTYLDEPPVNDAFLDNDGNISTTWRNWLMMVTETLGLAIVHDVLFDNSGAQPRYEPIGVLRATPMKQADRDVLKNARNGTIIYNLDTDRINAREGGAWYYYTRNPA